MNRNFKLAIFDLDGTLIDTRKDIVRATNLTLEKLGYPTLPETEIIANVGYGPGELILRCINKELTPKQTEQAKSTFSKVYHKNLIVDTEFFPGMVKLLESLSDLNLAIVTNKSTLHLEKTLNHLDGNHFFDFIQGIDSNNPPKPNPAGILKALKTTGCKPKDAVFIGDSEIDIKTGKAAEVKTCAVTWGYRSPEQLKKLNPDYLATTLQQLKNIL